MDNGTNEIYEEFSNIKAAGFKEPAMKEISDLINNKTVEDNELFVIEGLWAYEKILSSKISIKTFAFCPEYIKSPSMKSIVHSFIELSQQCYTISQKLCTRLSSRDGASGFFIVCTMPKYNLNNIKLNKNNLIVVLDGLEKLGNVGTIIRSADGAGGDAIILCNSRLHPTNSKLIKASMGASFFMPVIETNITTLVSWLKKNHFKIILTDLTAKNNYFQADYSDRIAIVAGNEIHGVSKEWYEHKCEKVIIPMLGGADSLNVGVATTLVVYEASLKQKQMLNRCS